MQTTNVFVHVRPYFTLSFCKEVLPGSSSSFQTMADNYTSGMGGMIYDNVVPNDITVELLKTCH